MEAGLHRWPWGPFLSARPSSHPGTSSPSNLGRPWDAWTVECAGLTPSQASPRAAWQPCVCSGALAPLCPLENDTMWTQGDAVGGGYMCSGTTPSRPHRWEEPPGPSSPVSRPANTV